MLYVVGMDPLLLEGKKDDVIIPQQFAERQI
jgi:hypothetical protein